MTYHDMLIVYPRQYGKRALMTRLTETPIHEFESESNAPEGGTGPCAQCGQSRRSPVHK